MSDNQVLINGQWIEAKPVPYYPNPLERLLHKLGKHVLTYDPPKYCVMPGCDYKEV